MWHQKTEVNLKSKFFSLLNLRTAFFYSEEIFYQILVFDFGNFGKIEYDPPLSLKELAVLGLKCTDETSIEDAADTLVEVIINKSDCLKSYYNLTIEDGKLYSLPLLIGKREVKIQVDVIAQCLFFA